VTQFATHSQNNASNAKWPVFFDQLYKTKAICIFKMSVHAYIDDWLCKHGLQKR